MSSVDHNSFDPRLIEMMLGRLSAAEAAEVRAEIAAKPEMAREQAALQEAFGALDSIRAETASAGAIERILARTATAAGMRIVRPVERLAEEQEYRNDFIFRFANFRDIVAIAAMLVLAVGIGVPGLLQVRERNQRIGCSWNLAQVGQGLQAYATTFNAAIPFAGFGKHNSWLATNDPNVETTPNRKHVFPLLKQNLVAEPRVFVCPARMDSPMAKDEIANRSDFPESRNVSYAYYNMAGVRPTLKDNPNLVILADDNPLFEDGSPLFGLRVVRAIVTTNSRAHRGAGQNTLTLDGHVKYATTPDCGVDGDNIWTLEHTDQYTGREGPLSASDSHLLK